MSAVDACARAARCFAQRHPVDPVIPGDPFDEPHQVAPGYHRGAL